MGEPSRSCHGEGSIHGAVIRKRKRRGSPRGMGCSTRARIGAEQERPDCAALSGSGTSYKPKAKGTAAQRESEGIVVPVKAVKAVGGKGPCGGGAEVE